MAHFVVAVDGSESARRAFDTALALQRPGDKLDVVSVVDPLKSSTLKPDYQPASIETYYTTHCTSRVSRGSPHAPALDCGWCRSATRRAATPRRVAHPTTHVPTRVALHDTRAPAHQPCAVPVLDAPAYRALPAPQLPKGAWSVRLVNKEPFSGLRATLMAAVRERVHERAARAGASPSTPPSVGTSAPALLVIGSHGRTGPKEDPLVLGSKADYSLRDSPLPALVVKGPALAQAVPATFVVAVDGSDRAHGALQLALRLRRPADPVRIVHVRSRWAQRSPGAARMTPRASLPRLPTDAAAGGSAGGDGATTTAGGTPMAAGGSGGAGGGTAASSVESAADAPDAHRAASSKFDSDVVEARYEAAAAAAPGVTFASVPCVPPESVADALLRAAEDAGGDVLVCGIDGLGAYAQGRGATVGSTSDAVARRARLSVLLYREAPGRIVTDAAHGGPLSAV